MSNKETHYTHDLSVLIPGRNEEWLAETLADLLKNIRGNTEIIVVIDGEMFPKKLPTDPRLTIIEHKKSRGQRASTNDAAKIATGRYLMKTDAHTAWDKGFDIKLLQGFRDLGDDITQVPVMRNLHVFDWVCKNNHRRYQGPSGKCPQCGANEKRDILWCPKRNPQSTSYRFDHELHFQYFNEWKDSEIYKEQLKSGYTETMSLQGSCFALSAERYWSLNICDEEFGSWGAQGTEVACKTWLSGGQCIVNHSTWYAHLFRTQGGDFSFPYKQDENQVKNARQMSQKLFLDNLWHLQKYPLIWLIDKFENVPNWHDGGDVGMYKQVKDWGQRFVVR